MALLLDALQLSAGIALLIAGGEAMVRGAAALARQLGVSPLVVGLTVVAFGTSAPELAVNVTAAARGNGAVAFGNIMGSNLANIGLILAGSALLRGLSIQSIVIARELPMMLLASVAALIMGFDALRGQADARFDRSDGLLLLMLFGIFLYYTIAETLRRRGTDAFVQQVQERAIGDRFASLGRNAGLVAIGVVGLALGGHWTVAGAVDIAISLGVSKGLIGLTVVAVGTSLPELSASVLAARRGEADLAIGNVVGSNIFNVLFVLGLTASIHPVPVPEDGHVDLVVVAAVGAALLLVSAIRRSVDRSSGALFLLFYLGYVTWRASAGSA